MRTNIEIDDKLLNDAMRSIGARTKKAAVEEGLRLLVKTHAQVGVRQLKGKVRWERDLNESRKGRPDIRSLKGVLASKKGKRMSFAKIRKFAADAARAREDSR